MTGTRIKAVPAMNSELRIDFSLVDDDEPETVYEIQVLSGVPGGEAAHGSEAIEVQGDTPAGRIEDVRYDGGNEFVLFRIRQFQENGSEDVASRGERISTSRNSAIFQVSCSREAVWRPCLPCLVWLETGYFRIILPRSFSFSQKCSISSVSGMRSNGMVAVHGRS
jgi:hypothetical protein